MPSTLDLAGRLAGVVAVQQEILSAITDFDPLLHVIVARAVEITGGDGAVIELAEGDDLVYRAASGPVAAHLGLRFSLKGSSLSGQAVRERTLLRSDDTETDLRVDGPACRATGIRSMIVAPLLDGSNVVGVLKAYAGHPNAFDDLDTYAVQLLAGMTSVAVIRAREFRERRLSEQRYRMLFEQNVAGVFRTTPDGRILDCNEALVKVFGYESREAFMSTAVWDLYQDRADREAMLADLRASKVMMNVHLRMKRRDGSPVNTILNLSELPGTEGDQLIGTLVEDPERNV